MNAPSQPPGLGFIEAVSAIVPPRRRDAWRKEWEAEVTYAWRGILERGRPAGSVIRLRLRVLTCLIDALWERKETMKMTGLFNDLRFAVRSLARHPSFAFIAVLTLALGIGANTAVFTLVDGVMLSPLPYDEPEQLVSLEHQGRDGRDALPMSQGLYVVYRDRSSVLDAVALHALTAVNLMRNGEPERIAAQWVTPSFFGVLGVDALLGRTFTEDEGAPGAEPTVILSHGLWETGFARDPSVIGQTLDVNGTTRTIVGVMPTDFGFPDRQMRLWLPFAVDEAQAPLAAFGSEGIARLSEGTTPASLDAELQSLIGRLEEWYPDSGAPAFLREVNLRPVVRPLKAAVVGDLDRTLWVLLGTVGLVLLIACANVANLLLVRAESRQRELALRVAVGAGRSQVIRSFMSESVVLATVGAAAGLAIASVALRLAIAQVPMNLPRIDEIGLDLRVLSFTLGVTVVCAAFFGLFPLVRFGVDDLASRLRDGGARGSTGGRDTNKIRGGLVVAQMALALVLLIGSGLMLRSFQALRAVDPGFDSEGVLTARITIPTAEMDGWQETAGFFRALRDRLEGQAGVESVGMALSTPLAGNGVPYYSTELEDHPRAESELPVFARQNQVEAGFFEAMGIEPLEGRTIQRGDGAEEMRAVVVSQRFAELWWPDASPIGRRIRQGPQDEWWQVVGVVPDAHYLSLEEVPEEMIYWPATLGTADEPQPTRSMDVVVRTSGDPLDFLPVLRREAQSLNSRIPVSNPRALTDIVSAATSRTSFTMSLLGTASGIALLLGLVGIYGVISYIVSQRTREIGVRMALGASAGSVRNMVVRQGLLLAVGGVVLGLVASGALSSVVSSLLYGVSATDPLTYASVSVLLVAISVVACWIPAARAAGVDPSRALRSE
ncbi:MAG: ABC transporter permease [Gemmatimonadetes bacterium]|nr:ABC transporter permease [Gemmatimonadota bacterium]NNF12456.1 ABC transporter permease [Gemmatimonadota bacterium]NNL30264.1 ABC transporter permease [Gemmatimonadota bacterium]